MTLMPDSTDNRWIMFWHRELAPLDAEPVSEHVAEADSPRMQGHSSIAASSESVDSRHDEATGEVWLHGSVRFLLLRRQR